MSNHENEKYVLRFTPWERTMHAVLVTTFLGLAATGLPLRFSSAQWARGLAGAIGGFGTILFIHEFCAVVLTIFFLAHVANIGFRVLIKKEYGLVWGRTTLVPQLKDFQDFFAHIRWFLWLGPKPKFDRYAYWDKVDYWAVFWGMAIIGFSGYAMWFAPFFAKFMPGSLLNVALLVHGEEALLAVSFIFLIHFFNTHLRPHNFPMDLTIFTGKEPLEELVDRHPEEYDRLVKTGELQKLERPAPTPLALRLARSFGRAAIVIGLLLVTLTIVTFVRG
jgi:cytochrome b subunit of formate dehydrogenase